MAERPNNELAADVYDLAVERLEGFTQGEFFYGNRGIPRRLRLQLTPPLNSAEAIADESKAILDINLNPETPGQVEYTFDPSNFSTVSRRAVSEHVANPGIWRRLLRKTPRLEASAQELSTLDYLIARAEPTPEFQAKINAEEARVQFAELDRRVSEKERERRAILEAEGRSSAAERESRIREHEQAKMAQAEEKVTEVLKQAELIEGRKGLGVIVEDFTPKVQSLRKEYAEVKPDLDYSLIFHWIKDPEDAIRQITALQKLNLQGTNLPIFIFMDGLLEGKYTTGIATINALAAKLQESGLPMPYLVGNAGDSWRNTELQELYPDYYITTYARDIPWVREPDFDYKSWKVKPFMDIASKITTPEAK